MFVRETPDSPRIFIDADTQLRNQRRVGWLSVRYQTPRASHNFWLLRAELELIPDEFFDWLPEQ